MSLSVEDVTVQEPIISTETEEEDAVVDAGAVVLLFLGDGVGEGVEGDFDLFLLGEAVWWVGFFEDLALLEVESHYAEGVYPF